MSGIKRPPQPAEWPRPGYPSSSRSGWQAKGLVVSSDTSQERTVALSGTPVWLRGLVVVLISGCCLLVPQIAMASPAVQTPQVALVSAASGKATSAMNKALSKLGAPYVWGATGPNAFDCSGLVSWSYKQIGVSLPRSSAAQSRVGTPVAKSDLRPGDLVFFYNPVSHVAIYIGNGKVVHASTSGQPVKISELSRMPFNSARRI